MRRIAGSVSSRRDVARGVAVLADGGAAMASGLDGGDAAAQDDKISRTSAHYQATPSGAGRCGGCAVFMAPAACGIVTGTISPTGWCVFYAPRR